MIDPGADSGLKAWLPVVGARFSHCGTLVKRFRKSLEGGILGPSTVHFFPG